jgi:DNA (cytosine-5)-methyltransferase 1
VAQIKQVSVKRNAWQLATTVFAVNVISNSSSGRVDRATKCSALCFGSQICSVVAGGLSLGMAEAARRLGFGIKIALAIDNDEDAVKVYRSNFPGADVRTTSVEAYFDGELRARRATKTEENLRREIGKVDVLVGGPPCQGHSDLNNHTRRNDSRNALYARMARAAWLLKPLVVLIENVPTVRHDVEEVLELTMHALVLDGYRVYDSVVDLSALGVPQRRRRHVMLGSRLSDIDPRRIIQSLTVCGDEHNARSVCWAIRDLVNRNGDAYNTPSTSRPENTERIAHLFENDLYDLPNHLRPVCHQADHSYRSMYGRLRWDEPAQTVTSGFGSMGQGRYVHPLKPRMITPHEAARLQMLPDFMTLQQANSRGAIARMIGNCVPPPLGIEIGQMVLKSVFRSRRKRPPTAGTKERRHGKPFAGL